MALTFLAPMAHDARFPGTGTVGVYIVAGLTLVFVRLIFVLELTILSRGRATAT